MVSKILCLSCINIWWYLLDPVRNIHAVIRMKVNINKGICPECISNVLDGFRDDHDELPLVYPDINILPFQLPELPCLSLLLICLEFIIGSIESACPSLILPNPDPLLLKCFEAFSDIAMILESIICDEGPPLWEVMNHLQIIWRDRDVYLYK